MGVSSNTIHLRGVDHEAVVRCYTAMLRREGFRPRSASRIPHYRETRDEPVFRRVLVSHPVGGWVTVIDQTFDEQNLRVLKGTCQRLTRSLSCDGVCFLVHDSEAFYYYCFQSGQVADRYCSWPAWYSDRPPRASVRARWRGSPAVLLPWCRPGTTLAELRDILQDYSREPASLEPPVWAEAVLRELADCMAIEDPVRTYGCYHNRRPGLYLAVPGGEGQMRIDREELDLDPYWEDFVHYGFMRVGE